MKGVASSKVSDMAENESKDHPETPASTPTSTNDPNSGLKAAKDRSCPFCGQAFTSSSLGRHLDLYIKPKNPKPPDGVHDLDEIRKIRGGITRRQPRTSSKGSTKKEDATRRDSSGWSSIAPNKSGKGGVRTTDGSPVESPDTAKDEQPKTWFNAPSWHATGVINDLPARPSSRNNSDAPTTSQAQRLQEMRRDTAGNRIERPEYVAEDIWKLQEAAEVGRAAEMALREVLGSLEAAKKKVEPQTLYEDFDFCSLSFPGLCLAILPPPPTLFSSTPFPAAHTWSLSPPGEKQLDALNRMVNERVNTIRKGRRENFPDSVVFQNHVHLQGAYEHWQLMPESDKIASWNLEVSRAFVRAKEKKDQLRSDLEIAQQRIRHLEAEYDRLSRCQLPREYLLHPPNTAPISSAVMKEAKFSELLSGAYEANFDADVLLNKWKSTVKATTRSQKPAPTESYTYVESRRNPLKGDIMLNGSVFGVNGPMPRDIDSSIVAEHPTIMYETPQNPGAVIDAEDEGNNRVADADADGEADEENSFRSYLANSGALTKLRSAGQNAYNSPPPNANGKRPLGSTATSGRSSGPKVYREQPKA